MTYKYSGYTFDQTKKREYAIVLYLPKRIDEVVAPLREKYDPDCHIIAAHINLAFPFETEKPLVELSQQLREVARNTRPIRIELDSVGDFYPATPVIYWAIKENAALSDLYQNLYSGMGMSAPHPILVPHTTIAREISRHRVVLVKDKIAAFLNKDVFTAEFFDLVSPIADNRWVSVRTFPLQEPES